MLLKDKFNVNKKHFLVYLVKKISLVTLYLNKV